MAESTNIADLVVTLGADVKDYFEGMNKAIEKTKEVETTLNAVGTGMSAAFTIPLAALGTAAIAAAGDIKGAFNEIIISTGATGEALDGLKGSFEKVFADVDDSAKEVAGVIADLAKRLDLAGAPLESLSKQIIELSEITHSSSAEMATSVSKMFQIWKMGADQQGASLDYLFNVFQKTGASVSQLSTELTQFGPQLNKLGLDFQQSAVFLGQLEKAGVPATVALKGMRSASEEVTRKPLITNDP